jgi:hypothetical protein
MMGPFQGGNNTHVGVVGSETGGVILDLHRFFSKRNQPRATAEKVAECAGVVRDRPVHRWARGARARRPCAASIIPSASSTPAEGLRGARLPALLHPACPLDACERRNRQVRTSTRTLRPATREVAQRAQSHARVLLNGRR